MENVLSQIQQDNGRWMDYARTTPKLALANLGIKINNKPIRYVHWIYKSVVLSNEELELMKLSPEKYHAAPPGDSDVEDWREAAAKRKGGRAVMLLKTRETRLKRLDNAWRKAVFYDHDFLRAFAIARATDRLLQQMQEAWEGR